MTEDETRSLDDRRSPDAEIETTLSLDTAFELLANRRRRFVIYTLTAMSTGVMAFDDLVTAVGKLNREANSESVTDCGDEELESDLHHWHLPILVEEGIIRYDDRSGIVQFVGDPRLKRWATRVKDEELRSEGMGIR